MAAAEALAVGAAAGGSGARLLAEVERAVARGKSLSAALTKSGAALSSSDLALVRAGERGGDLAHALELLARRLTEQSSGRRRAVQVAIYPAVLLAMTTIVLVMMGAWVLPSFSSIYQGSSAELPAATRIFMGAGNSLAVYGPFVALAVLAVAVALSGARTYSSAFALFFDRLLLHVPLIGRLIRARVRTDLYATLAALLAAAIDLDEALGIATPAVTNAAAREAFVRARHLVRRGSTLSTALERSGIDRTGTDSAIVRVAEATGDYVGCLERLAAAARLEREETLARVLRIIEPTAVVWMALVVGGAVLAVYQPVLGSAALLAGGSP